MSGLITAAVIAGGAAVAAGAMSNKASKDAAAQMRDGVISYDPLRPPDPTTVDWRREVVNALNFNNANFPRAAGYANQVNQFNTRQAQKQYRTFQPYFDSLQRQVGANALSFSQGELPADVVANIGRTASQRGLSGGFGQGARGGGSGTAMGNSLLRGLGLTSLDLSKFGTQLAMNASMQAKQLSPGLYDPTQMLPTTGQAIGYGFQNAGIQNDAARYWNQTQNQALAGNVGAQNTANTNATNTELAGQLAQAQSIAAAGQAVGGVAGNYATNQYMPQQGGAYAGAGMTGGYQTNRYMV
jgi:hypothetical protein